ncbi:TetR/AcrR family transcriptional regulator [Cryobacterium frigoriphilum]|uniref:TetR/AcrR family transcriptional regulator n=1 Tax=Cryobacterium frigoriphilum TaxID=1259150 RepID=A0A4R8ZV05_9MICO|nr:TetR-like C-terminal domain-containing protein [Cryobacterium frigoriphilum]TFD46778.1 TetR/AcrR family transcriptional regulator [Cryobacterium frigoriphilum]
MSNRRMGRPMDPEIQNALLAAAEAVMVGPGFSQLTVDGLARSIGSTRPTFYRRYLSVAHIAFDVIASKFGTGEPPSTGSLLGDLETLQRADIAMFSSDLFRKNLPGLLESIRTDDAIRQLYGDAFVARRRENLGRVIEAAIERGEQIRADWDLDLVSDVLVGPILARTLLPGTAVLDDDLACVTARVAYGVLSERRDRRPGGS